jgi:DNA-directed RNA polymerase specialized sigma24 family protein
MYLRLVYAKSERIVKRKERFIIGVVKRDTHEGERRLDAAYPGLHTATGVKALLRDWPRLRANAVDRGDYDAILLLADLELAMAKARLTAKQREVLRLVYYEDLTQQMAADVLGVTRENVTLMLQLAASNIAEIYERWVSKV